MTDTLTITQSQGPVTVLHLAGKLNAQTQAMLLDTARAQKAAGTSFLLIDLGNVEFITSAGLGALHNIYRLFTPQAAMDAWEKEKHGEPYKSEYMKLASASPSVYYVLNIAGFLQHIPIYREVDEALESFPGRDRRHDDQKGRG
ncbi:MAG TPA: STAS domain-containing protein [Anaerolineales bacterium]